MWCSTSKGGTLQVKSILSIWELFLSFKMRLHLSKPTKALTFFIEKGSKFYSLNVVIYIYKKAHCTVSCKVSPFHVLHHRFTNKAKKKKKKKKNCFVALKWNLWIFGSVGREMFIFLIICLKSTQRYKIWAYFPPFFAKKKWKNTQSDKNWVHSRP